MSNFPTPNAIPPTSQQVSATLRSVIAATHALLGMDPGNVATLRPAFMQFYSHPTFQLVLGIPSHTTPAPSPPDHQLKAELAEIKSTILALSKAVSGLPPKTKGTQVPPAQNPPPPKGNPSAQGKGPSHVTPPTFASKAAAKARPSLVLDMGAQNPDHQLDDELAGEINAMLQQAGFVDVKLSAARYTKKGNLVLTAHHATSQHQLNSASPTIKTFVEQLYASANLPTPPTLTARSNVKWSKILINSVPVGSAESRGPWTPEECHRSLIAHNPSYAALTVTQKPSWVRPPSSLQPGSHSSLVVAFEDPVGEARRSLLASRQLYLLGVRAKVSRWKEKPRTTHEPPTPRASSEEQVTLELTPLSLSRPSTPDTPMAEDPFDQAPPHDSKRKHQRLSTPTKPKPSSSPKKKKVG
jgi:hypothetical protein